MALVEDAHEVRVIEACGGQGAGPEVRDARGILDPALEQADRDREPRSFVAGGPQHAHAAAAHPAQEPVATGDARTL